LVLLSWLRSLSRRPPVGSLPGGRLFTNIGKNGFHHFQFNIPQEELANKMSVFGRDGDDCYGPVQWQMVRPRFLCAACIAPFMTHHFDQGRRSDRRPMPAIMEGLRNLCTKAPCLAQRWTRRSAALRSQQVQQEILFNPRRWRGHRPGWPPPHHQ